MWAGGQVGLPKVHDSKEKRAFTSTVQVLSLSSGRWSSHPATSTPPLGVYGYTCRAVADKLYYFGGWCNHDRCFHNSINQLDTTILKWTELAPTDPNRPVMRRAYGGMIPVQWDGVYHLLIIGGEGSPPTVQLPHVKYMEDSEGYYSTNEHTLFNLSTSKITHNTYYYSTYFNLCINFNFL